MPGGTTSFTNQSSTTETNTALQYVWSFGDGASSTSKDASHVYATAKDYTVSLIAKSTFGCADTTTKTFNHFVANPVAGFDVKETNLCQGAAISFIDNSIIANAATAKWNWKFSDGTTSAASDPVKTFGNSGDYKVTLTVNNEGCISSEAEKTITINKAPLVDAGPDLLTEPARAVTLQASVDDAQASIQWTPAQYLSSATIIRPQALPLNSQLFYITATNAEHCSSTDSILVKVFRDLKIPNAFSPNGDGVNDKWNIPGLADYQDATVEVYNRWGQIVFRSKGYSVPWDGTINGTPLPMGAYYYVIAPNAKGYGKFSGSVVIVR
jgi:gliding motility-associated-like protein